MKNKVNKKVTEEIHKKNKREMKRKMDLLNILSVFM